MPRKGSNKNTMQVEDVVEEPVTTTQVEEQVTEPTIVEEKPKRTRKVKKEETPVEPTETKTEEVVVVEETSVSEPEAETPKVSKTTRSRKAKKEETAPVEDAPEADEADKPALPSKAVEKAMKALSKVIDANLSLLQSEDAKVAYLKAIANSEKQRVKSVVQVPEDKHSDLYTAQLKAGVSADKSFLKRNELGGPKKPNPQDNPLTVQVTPAFAKFWAEIGKVVKSVASSEDARDKKAVAMFKALEKGAKTAEISRNQVGVLVHRYLRHLKDVENAKRTAENQVAGKNIVVDKFIIDAFPAYFERENVKEMLKAESVLPQTAVMAFTSTIFPKKVAEETKA